jgi:internalin A
MKIIPCTCHRKQGAVAIIGTKLLCAMMYLFITAFFGLSPVSSLAASDNKDAVLHAFYPSNVALTDQVKSYIDQVDSLSFAWARMDATAPEVVNTVKGLNGNQSFYYPKNYLQAVEYAKSKGKTIQINIYMDGKDCTEVLPYEDKRDILLQAIVNFVQADISAGEGIYYDGVVIDFEGLRNTGAGSTILYGDQPVGNHFVQFLKVLKSRLKPIDKKLYVAVNPSNYYDGYDYAAIMEEADSVILMAHDYEPTERLQKNQVQQYTGYDALVPINSMAPIMEIRDALNELQAVAADKTLLSKIWLQITFDSAQWQFGVSSADDWENLSATSLSREGRSTPLYKSIKARVDNTDRKGERITYGYNNELQTPYIQYYNNYENTWNVILYEDSNSIRAKVELARAYGLGGISVWSLANVPDYTDTKGKEFHLDGWTTLLEQMSVYLKPLVGTKQTVSFTDAGVEQAIRDKLGKPTGKLTMADINSIYRLKLPEGTVSLKDLKHMKNLEYLDSQQLGIKDISGLSSLTKLRVLYLQRNSITDINALKKLSKLEILSLNGNGLTDIKSLSALTKMKKLYLRENKLKDITPLGKLTDLNTLEIGNNKISKVDAIKNNKKLKLLALDNNQISSIQAIKGLTGLESLYLQRNTISDITALSSLKKLKLISLNGNKISSIKPLSKLTKLELLYLKDNKLKDITVLKGLTGLKELYLSGNQISNYAPVAHLLKKTDFSSDFK